MKMNYKFKALVVSLAMAASAPALAVIENGELLLDVRYYTGATPTSGDAISGLFDLGFKMNDMIALNGQTDISKSWNLTGGAYGASWNQVLNFVSSHGGNTNQIYYNVIALDTVGARYLTTANVDAYPGLTNGNLKGFQGMQAYVDANNSRGTHATDANGASTATPTDALNSFFGAINGSGMGDTWLQKTTVNTTQPLGTAQNFWLLTTSSSSTLAQATKTPFGAAGGELSKFNLNADGTLTFTSPVSAVPEADTWAMLLAGLGMLGMMVRRRTSI
ncbi:MAG: hypothetical protein Tsb0026_20630 [Sulfuricaulis sp.]